MGTGLSVLSAISAKCISNSSRTNYYSWRLGRGLAARRADGAIVQVVKNRGTIIARALDVRGVPVGVVEPPIDRPLNLSDEFDEGSARMPGVTIEYPVVICSDVVLFSKKLQRKPWPIRKVGLLDLRAKVQAAGRPPPTK